MCRLAVPLVVPSPRMPILVPRFFFHSFRFGSVNGAICDPSVFPLYPLPLHRFALSSSSFSAVFSHRAPLTHFFLSHLSCIVPSSRFVASGCPPPTVASCSRRSLAFPPLLVFFIFFLYFFRFFRLLRPIPNSLSPRFSPGQFTYPSSCSVSPLPFIACLIFSIPDASPASSVIPLPALFSLEPR